MRAAKSTTVATSWDSKRAIHRSALRNGKALIAMPGMRSLVGFNSVTILSDPVLVTARYSRDPSNTRHATLFAQLRAKEVALVTLVVLRAGCQSSRRNVGYCADDMGRAARTWHHGRCSTATDGAHPCRNIFVLTRADPSPLSSKIAQSSP